MVGPPAGGGSVAGGSAGGGSAGGGSAGGRSAGGGSADGGSAGCGSGSVTLKVSVSGAHREHSLSLWTLKAGEITEPQLRF